MQESGDNTFVGYRYAGFWARYAAYLIDKLIIFLGLIPVRIIFEGVSLLGSDALKTPVLFSYSVKDIVFYVCGALYFVLLTYHTGSTLGKRIFNIKVVSARTGRVRPTFTDILYRETIGRFLCGILYIGYIFIAFDIEKRGFHDRLCDTRVIYRN